ncbi:MAG: bifunctional methylenetetrahydrofolate dehydrogenase/methenyltetrahydrofolate cyclohydrolase FolD [Ignavibacteriae bacterium HGW-Ignavibacteriae-2]|nr:MAG: bifunctional methylenetetrahydrofolate dehydrogenase/methenyltetrahydrofolate cyclohydrolase FolD [Ignavibacteriae bacterium HGW-Ignavibacteriae-2]
MVLIDGKAIAEDIRRELKEKVDSVRKQHAKVPGLVTIIVGDNPASRLYVNMKSKACNEIGMMSKIEELSADISEEELLQKVKQYNNNTEYHGILVQLPLPKHINEDRVIESISVSKDVDGFHPVNTGNLMIGKDTFYPCTPYGIKELLKRYDIETKGKHVVVVGRSNIVGKPIANMMLQKKEGANSVVTVCHSAANNLSVYTKQADILIAAIGKANFITEDMVKDGVVVIDVGINRIEDPATKSGYRVVGDVDFENVAKKASYITPVPKGVGPMTIAMLLVNTFEAFTKIEKV